MAVPFEDRTNPWVGGNLGLIGLYVGELSFCCVGWRHPSFATHYLCDLRQIT